MEQDIQKEQFDRFSAELPEDVRKALWDLLQCPHFDQELCPVDGELKIEVDSGAACVRYLTLHHVSGVPVGADWLDFESLIKRRDEYRLVGEAQDYSTEETKLFTIRFSHAEVDTQVYRVESPWQEGKPWETLVFMAIQLMVKYSISPTLFNNREQSLLPLMAELASLSHYSELPEWYDHSTFPQLRKIIEDHGGAEVLPILEKLEQNEDFSKKNRYLRSLFAKLDTARYEPLFRSIWNRLCESQQDYPSQAQIGMEESKLIASRNHIQALMEQRGYCGTYPDYYKNASMKGIRLADSYGMDYFVMGEKNAVSHIHFNEIMDNGLCLELICGTQLLKKNQERGDYLSCMFDTKGRTFAKAIFCEADQLEILLPIADKLAQLQRLNREERKLRNAEKQPALLVFLVCLILGGGAFALLTMPVMMLICALFLLPSGELHLMLDVPWLYLLLFCWLGYGGLVGIVMALIEKFK